ncbi:MAG: alpha-L-fucosidase, partial [Prevotella nanceiensis]|nr:alpha-L-fucosidase [Hoylesella nanceiensis]
MKKTLLIVATLLINYVGMAQTSYQPTAENLKAREQFQDQKFGVFLHWGLYSMMGVTEWIMTNRDIHYQEYPKLAKTFYPSEFDADAWISAIKVAGAKYITITTRHHDGFSLFKTATSSYNSVDGTPFKRDIIKELAEACKRHDIKLHLYYSHLDWGREDYPVGRTGRGTGRPKEKANWPSYFNFMNTQLTELLTNYGEVGAIWFDGWWDHDNDAKPFDWQLEEQYGIIHKLQPQCLIGNNHHTTPFPGEDIQIFERDLPGENKAGLSGQDISRLPLESCQTINEHWGYSITDSNYKSGKELIQMLVRAAGKNANLLLNIGPEPGGALPSLALDRLK